MSRAPLVPLLIVVSLLLTAPIARAAYEPLASGATKLSLDRSFLALLKQTGVKLAVTAPATLAGGVVSLPVSGGKFDPAAAKGTVEHGGALAFKANGKSVPIRSLQLKTTQKRSPLSAKVGGSQLKLASAKRLVVSRAGFGDKVKVTSLSLSAKLATRLGKKLGLRGVFKQGQALGSTTTLANPQTISVLGQGKASFSFDPGFQAKLDSLFVAVNPIFPTEHIGPLFTLPIFGGTISPDATLGRLETSGSLEFLQLGGGQVFWAEQWLDFVARTASPEVDLQPSPPYSGKLGRTAVATFTFTAPALADARARTVTVASAALALDAATAAAFNQAFAQGKEVFRAGDAVGALGFTAQGQ